MSQPDFGVYLHIPFCASRCDYCSFATWTDRFGVAEAYVDAVRRDIVRSYAPGQLPPAGSVFFGGGTPSILPGPLLMTLLDAIPCIDNVEVTVECNPDTVTAELLDAFGDRLLHVHVSDNHGGDRDEHLPLGAGNIDWPGRRRLGQFFLCVAGRLVLRKKEFPRKLRQRPMR